MISSSAAGVCPHPRKRALIEADLEGVIAQGLEIRPYDHTVAAWHAAKRARLTAAGSSPSFADGQIAAIAKGNHLVLVTRNITDFEPFSGLNIENWHL